MAVVLALAVCPLALGQGVPGGPDPIPQAPDPVPQAPAPTPTPTPAPRPSTPAPSAPATPASPATPATPVTPAGPTPAEIKAKKAEAARARAAERRRKAEERRRRIAEEKRRQAAEKRQKELSTLSAFSETLTKASTRVGNVRIELPASASSSASSPSASAGVGRTIPLLLVLAALVCGGLAVLPSMIARRDPRLSHSGGLVAVATHRMELTAVAASCLLIALFILGLN